MSISFTPRAFMSVNTLIQKLELSFLPSHKPHYINRLVYYLGLFSYLKYNSI